MVHRVSKVTGQQVACHAPGEGPPQGRRAGQLHPLPGPGGGFRTSPETAGHGAWQKALWPTSRPLISPEASSVSTSPDLVPAHWPIEGKIEKAFGRQLLSPDLEAAARETDRRGAGGHRNAAGLEQRGSQELGMRHVNTQNLPPSRGTGQE